MISSGKVTEINGNKVKLKMYRESSCAHCSGCGDASKLSRELELEIKQKVEIGDIVTFELEDGKMLKIGFLVYIVPILMMILGFYISTRLGYTEKIGALISFLFLVIAFLIVHLIDKFLVKEKVQMNVLKVEKDTEEILQDSCSSKK